MFIVGYLVNILIPRPSRNSILVPKFKPKSNPNPNEPMVGSCGFGFGPPKVVTTMYPNIVRHTFKKKMVYVASLSKNYITFVYVRVNFA